MNGLLNIGSDPLVGLGIGLLAGGQPGGSLAGGLSQGLQGMQNIQQSNQANQANQMNMLKLKMLQDQQEQAARQQQNFQGLLSSADPQTRQLLGVLGPEAGAQLLAQQMTPMKPKDKYMAVDGRVFDATTGQFIGGGQSIWTPDKIMSEFDLSKYEPQSVDAALSSSDPGKLAPMKGAADFKDVVTMRKMASTELDPIREGASNVRKLGMLLDSPNPMSDYAAMISFIKSLDPTSVVREGEVSMANSATSALTRLELALQKANKGGFMTPETRNQMKQAANELMKFYSGLYEKRSGNIGKMAGRYGINQEDVIGYAPNMSLLDVQSLPPQPPPGGAVVYDGPGAM